MSGIVMDTFQNGCPCLWARGGGQSFSNDTKFVGNLQLISSFSAQVVLSYNIYAAFSLVLPLQKLFFSLIYHKRVYRNR